MMEGLVSNHIIAIDVKDFPQKLHKYKDMLQGRSLLVKKAKVVPVECIVRGYLSGSGWKSYQKDTTVCGIKLPSGMLESSKIEQPIFTPSTKAETGHDINISFDEVKEIIGESTAMKLKDLTLKIYGRAGDHAEKKGIIIADTKMEFGIFNDEIIIIDELLTPDSSRFWGIKDYAPGRSQDSFDKQIVRDYLLTLNWDQTPPGRSSPMISLRRPLQGIRNIEDIVRVKHRVFNDCRGGFETRSYAKRFFRKLNRSLTPIPVVLSEYTACPYRSMQCLRYRDEPMVFRLRIP